MKRSYILIIVILVAVAAVGAIIVGHHKTVKAPSMSAGDMSSMNSSGSANSSDSAIATSSVTIQNFAFSPATITVKMGTKVTWTNKDSVAHTVTATTASADAPASADIAPNGTFSFTFNKVGTYAYECSIHPSMRGTVVVTN